MSSLPASTVVAVVGCGSMGQGIAQVAAAAGYPVLLHDTQAGAAQRAVARIGEAVAKLIEKGKLTAEQGDALRSNLSVADTVEALAPAGLVIEAIIEDLAVKKSLFTAIEAVVAPDALLTTNTSSLSVTAIGAALSKPERFAGLHFFNPAPVMQLVEIVRGLATDEAVAATLRDTVKGWGKLPVLCRSTPGFIVNRVARPFYAEALRVRQEQGADIATIDALLREAGGFRMGAFELMDLIGHDVNFAVTKSVHDAYFGDPRFQPSLIQQELVEAGRLGRKTGRGFYDYAEGAEKPVPAEQPQGPKPSNVVIEGDLGPVAVLLDMLQEAGISLKPANGAIRIALTDGRTALARGVDAVFDLALDYRSATRIGLAVSDRAPPETASVAAGLFQSIGKAVSPVDDLPGMVVMRTVAMLANEASDAVLQGVADAAGVDLAMMKGVNYPAGPLAWADKLGPARLLAVLDHLAQAYGEDRYRASPLLRRKALSGRVFHE